jgi:hypothetical protein
MTGDGQIGESEIEDVWLWVPDSQAVSRRLYGAYELLRKGVTMLVPGPSVLSNCGTYLRLYAGVISWQVVEQSRTESWEPCIVAVFRHHLVSTDPQLSQTCWYNGTQGMYLVPRCQVVTW